MPGDLFLSAHCAIRQFAIEGISALDVATELCIAELGWLARGYANGEAVALSGDQGRRLLDEIGDADTRRAMTSGSGWHSSGGWSTWPR